ncbi:MAG: hypothetical protein ACM3O3_05195 [Syntrophothermus sp.]
MKKVCQYCLNEFEAEDKNNKTCPDCEFETKVIGMKYKRIKEIEDEKNKKSNSKN